MKFQRQSKILELIEKEKIDTQEELSRRLKEWGFTTTQATISRDIKELRLVKVMTPDGTYKYTAATTENEVSMMGRIRNIFKECVVSISSAQNLVVIKTLPGLGSAAGYAIDAIHHPEVVGSIAGDDTVFVVITSTEKAAAFRDEASSLLD
ncbi:MAG: arginine repressor [Oscillospiraceae bacterium]|nr:arginine repressor [Oscillospiraceae bacterium]MBQ3880022.1 arginine repressor [Oscillospiraceae bacterium]